MNSTKESVCTAALRARFRARSIDEAIASLGEQYLRPLSIDAPRERLEALAKSLNVKIKTERLVGVDGLLSEEEDGYTVTLPRDHDATPSRIRFSLAHELAHLAIFQSTGISEAFGHRSQSLTAERATDIERLCDKLAAEFLMPRREWGRLLFELGLSASVLTRLADRYGVSLPAAARRAIDVGPWSAAFLFWRLSDPLTLECAHIWSSIRAALPGKPDPLQDSQPRQAPFIALAEHTNVTGNTTLWFGDRKVTFFGESWPTYGRRTPVVTLLLDERYPQTILDKSSRQDQYWLGPGKLF